MSREDTPLSKGERKLRVLHFAPRVSWPLDTGAKLRNYHLGRTLTEKARVTFLAFAGENRLHNELNFYRQLFSIPRDSHNSLMKVVRGAIGPMPLPLLNYKTRKMKHELISIFTSQVFDIAQLESIHLMPYLSTIRATRKPPLVVLDWHNVESELLKRYSDRASSLLRRTYAKRTAKLMERFEKRALSEFDAHLVVSDRDAARLRDVNPRAQVFVIENGVDAAYYSETNAPVEPGKNRVVFVGSMDYHANIDAAISFARNVWPRIHKRKPELIFSIVGRDPSAEVRELGSMPAVEVTGTVDDVRPYYDQALAAVVPLRVGGGSRLKILEAMAAGVPVVSTTLGAEGLEVKAGENILIADSDEELSEVITGLIDNEPRRQELVAAARDLVSERYDWNKIGAKLFDVYCGLLRA